MTFWMHTSNLAYKELKYKGAKASYLPWESRWLGVVVKKCNIVMLLVTFHIFKSLSNQCELIYDIPQHNFVIGHLARVSFIEILGDSRPKIS